MLEVDKNGRSGEILLGVLDIILKIDFIPTFTYPAVLSS
jgi:hypothetical protein